MIKRKQSQTHTIYDQDLKKDYGSAASYALEVEKWCHQTRFWMACQQIALAQSISLQMSQQYFPLLNSMSQNATVIRKI